MYKQASKLRLRFQTTRGTLSTEQLWDLSLTELDSLAVSLETDYKNSKGKSFLAAKTKKDKTIKLQFDIVLDILTTKVEEAEVERAAADVKEHNQKILSLIKRKEDAELEELSLDELKEQLK
jgi:hypothetical protein